jgi:hydroxyacylglutathione hydrolase
MRVVPVPCLKDNYAYLVVPDGGDTCAVVDPSEAEPVRAALAREGLRLAAIWCTHHHWDHVGGNEALAREHGAPVYGHASDRGRLPGLTHPLEDGAEVVLGPVLARVMHVPGHTLGAITYVVRGSAGASGSGGAEASDAAFTGDTLFVAGCGRLFEGTPAQMRASLARLAELAPETRVFCGHEYTEANLRFAAVVDAGNLHVSAAQARAAERRGRGEPTVPSTIGDERRTNPFFRAGEAHVRAAVGVAEGASAEEAFAAVRRAKDGFKA